MITSFLYRKIWSEIKKAKKILLCLHPSPDGDSIGSNLALYHILTKMGKKVTLLAGDSSFPNNFSTLPGVGKITPKNFFQIDQNDYDLFVIVDIGSVNQISRYGEVLIDKNLKTIVIDHHASNTKFGNINLLDVKAPAACQIVFDLFEKNKIKISKNMALPLFIGLYTDTGGFKYINTTSKTFLAAAKLTKINPDYNQAIFEIENNENADRLKFLSLMLSSVKTYFSGQIAIASISYESLKESALSPDVLNGSEIANMLKSVVGWQVGICMIESQVDSVKINFRTRDAKVFDVSKLAASVGGGGHRSAAGAVINQSLAKATKILLDNIDSLYPDLEKK